MAAGNGCRKWRTSVSKTAIWGQKQPFLGQNSPRTHSKQPNKGKVWVHFMCSLTFLCQRALCGPLTPPYVPETAQKGPQKPQILCRLAGDSHKPRIGHIFGYMAQNAIPRAPSPPAIPHFLWFPPLRIAQTDAWTPIPRPTRLRQAASSSPNRWVPKWVNGVQ